MRKKVVSAILCASMVAGMVVIPGVAVKADDKKLIGVTMPTKDLQRWNQDGENMKKSILEATGYLFDYLKYRKCAEYGEFKNWYRGDLKMNIKQRLYDTLKIIGQTPEMTEY